MADLAQDRSLAEAFAKSQHGEELEDAEEFQLLWWSACFLRSIETHVEMEDLRVVPVFDERWKRLDL